VTQDSGFRHISCTIKELIYETGFGGQADVQIVFAPPVGELMETDTTTQQNSRLRLRGARQGVTLIRKRAGATYMLGYYLRDKLVIGIGVMRR